MSKIVKNTTQNPISISDVGITVPASNQYVIPTTDYLLWAASDDIVSPVGSGDIVINDGSYDLSISDGIDLIKGMYQKTSVDPDGDFIIRPKAAKKGWTFCLIPIEIETSKIDKFGTGAHIHCKNFDGSDMSGISIKFYDSNDTELTSPTQATLDASCVKTVIDFEPAWDYEIIGGTIQQLTQPASPVRVWVVGVPDISYENGGSKVMVSGINLQYIDPTDKIEADGRVSKYMTYNATYHTNKLRFIFKHNTGYNHPLLINLQIYKL